MSKHPSSPHPLLIIVAVGAAFWLFFLDASLDAQDAERERQSNCRHAMNGLGAVPPPLTGYCEGVQP